MYKRQEIAYETVLTSFANGDLKKLKSLLTSTMNNNFSGAIDARNKDKIKSEFTFIGIKQSSVEKYEKVKDDIFATVKFVTDVWKFTRNIKNNSPNWYLAEIISQ